MAQSRIIDVTSNGAANVIIHATEEVITGWTAPSTPPESEEHEYTTMNLRRSSQAQYTPRNQKFGASSGVLCQRSVIFQADLSLRLGQKGTTTMTLKVGSLGALELWLRKLHGSEPSAKLDLNLRDVWHAIVFGDDYHLDPQILGGWFKKWWQENQFRDADKLRQLLYPCYRFNCADGFRAVTQALVYGSNRHITEQSLVPDRPQHHVPHRVIGSINGARGSLRSQLHRRLFNPIDHFLGLNCRCKEMALFWYCKGLRRTGIWPLEESANRISMAEMLQKLRTFNYLVPKHACRDCAKDYRELVLSVYERLLVGESSFMGLCLDCMDLSQPKAGDSDQDYWEHDVLKNWSMNCRFDHDQSTWYWSFMGRPEKRDEYNKIKAEAKEPKKGDRRDATYDWMTPAGAQTRVE